MKTCKQTLQNFETIPEDGLNKLGKIMKTSKIPDNIPKTLKRNLILRI